MIPFLKRFFLLDSARPRNAAMEGLRGLAVLLVFFVHFAAAFAVHFTDIGFKQRLGESLFVTAREQGSAGVFLVALSRQQYGVDLFFLLSGFLIMRLAARGQADAYVPFLWRRWLRIYPAFLLSLLAGVWLRDIRILGREPHWSTLATGEFLQNLLFLNGCPGVRCPPYNYVTWSLFPEFVFYLAFPGLLALWQRRARTGGLASIVLLAASVLLCRWLERFPMFLCGALLGMARDEDLAELARSMPTWAVAAVYLAVTGVYMVFQPSFAYFVPFYACAAALLFVKACFAEGWLQRLFAWTPLRGLGNISYSFYLVHGLCLTFLQTIAPPLLMGLRARVVFLIFLIASFTLSMVMSIVLFAIAERWYFRWRAGSQQAEMAPPHARAA
ncbi:MAG: acyltransferase family protein [Gemmataceae bacterium]